MQIRRVTKVVKGGKQLSFRAVVSGGGDMPPRMAAARPAIECSWLWVAV